MLVATAKETLIYARPSLGKSPKIGYLRAGDVVRRNASAEGHEGVPRRLLPDRSRRLRVCRQRRYHRSASRSRPRRARHADRTAPLPYVYGFSKMAGAPLYSRLPTIEEQHRAEPELPARTSHPGMLVSFDGCSPRRHPVVAAPDRGVVHWYEQVPILAAWRVFVLRTAIARSAFAFVSVFDSGGRSLGSRRTWRSCRSIGSRASSRADLRSAADGLAHPAGRVHFVPKSAALYSGDPLRLRTSFRTATRVSRSDSRHGQTPRSQVGRVVYLETQTSQWIVDPNLVLVEAVSPAPPWATPGRTWIDVSIDRQVLCRLRREARSIRDPGFDRC